MKEAYCFMGVLIGFMLGFTSNGYYIYSTIYKSNVETIGSLPMLKEVKK